MSSATVGLLLALIAAGFVLVAVTALFAHVRGPRQAHDDDAARRRMLHELEQYEDRTRAELRKGHR